MRRGRRFMLIATILVASAALAGLVGAQALAGQDGATGDKVKLQLKWVTQTQFAGYYAAQAKGYYEQLGLDVTIKPGGPDITPEQVVASGQAEFGIDWLPSLLATRDQGGDIVNIAQVFARSGMTEVTWKSSGITAIKQLRGKRVGVWCCGNEFELFAALVKNGMDPKNPKDVTIVNQPFDMNLFLQRKIDAAAAMVYGELAILLESKDPQNGKRITRKDLSVISLEKAGTSMLEDGVFVRGDWIKSAKNQDIAKRFLQASFKGWIYCRDHLRECVDIVLENGPTLGRGHQTWQLNEVNALIWPNTKGIGLMDPVAFKRTAGIAQQFKVIKNAPGGAYRTDLARAAVAALKKQGADINGKSFKKAVVKPTLGGK